MKKRFSLALSLIVAICMIAAVAAGTAIFSSAATSEDGLYEYTLSNNQATITKCKDTSITEFTLTKVDGYDIVGIGNHAFQSCENLATVTIPATVKTIGNGAFNGCIRLANLTVPEGVTSIGYNAFRGCTSLEEVSLPKSLEKIVEYYDDGAFRDCTNLKTVTFAPGGTKSATIARSAFRDCSKLESINLPGNYTSIGGSAFKGCTSLTSFAWATSSDDLVTQTIADDAFNGCENLVSISLPGHLTTVGNGAFYGCIRLKKAVIPEGVTSIGYNAFRGCTSLEEVSLPKSLEKIVESYDDGAFRNCTNLKTVTFAPGGTKSATIARSAFQDCSKLESINLPGNYTSIGRAAFAGCTSLTSFTWATSSDDLVTQTIVDNAFNGCENLASISLPGHLISIGNNAFSGCSALEYADYYNTEDEWNAVSKSNSALPNPIRIENNESFIRLIFKEEAPVYYTLTYKVDGVTYGQPEQLKEGDPIIPREAPAKEGYTFGGWSDIPETMPAYDVTIEGRFTKNPDPAYVTLANEENGVSVSFYEGDFGVSSNEMSVVVENLSANENRLGSYKLELRVPERTSMALYEIHMIDSFGAFVQPKPGKKVTVKVLAPQGIDLTNDFYVYHKKQDNTTEYLKLGNNSLRVDGRYVVFDIASFSEFAFVQEVDEPVTAQPSIAINGFMKSRSVDYKTTVNFSARVTDAPSGAKVHWYVNGKDSGTGETFTVKQATASYNIQAKLVGSDGKVLAESETESVSVNTGFFARLIAFFRNLFGSLPVITQG